MPVNNIAVILRLTTICECHIRRRKLVFSSIESHKKVTTSLFNMGVSDRRGSSFITWTFGATFVMENFLEYGMKYAVNVSHLVI